MFDISELFIQSITDSCYEHVTGGVNTYFCVYVYFSLLVPVCALCVCLCGTSNQSTSKTIVICLTPSVN